ncbi:MAG: hypothetical protein ACLS9I_00935 [Adlercreutzia equolifaciens]
MAEISSLDIVRWQNKLMSRYNDGKDTALPERQQSANRNTKPRGALHDPIRTAVRTMKMGSKDAKEMNFWTKRIPQIRRVMMESPMFFVIFRFSTGLGLGRRAAALTRLV